MRYFKPAIGLIILSAFLFSGCNKEVTEESTVLTELYKIYENGEISECEYNGETVYLAGINAYDAESKVYNSKGEVIGTCNYAFGQVDEICRQLKNCEVIYRCENHISGEPAVDKYGLGK